MNDHSRLTIFTPTFNRAYTLGRLYDSLVGQDCKDFSWLIVDDGSTDETSTVVEEWICESKVPIDYVRVSNGGKARAHNVAVARAESELFLCVDSDDYLLPRAVGRLLEVWDQVGSDTTLAGVVSMRGFDAKTPVGSRMPPLVKRSTLSSLYEDHGFRGDTVLLYRTSLLKKFPFEVPEGESFMGESFVYLRIDQEYELEILNEILYICEYLADGYTARARSLIRENPRAYTILNHRAAAYAVRPKQKFIRTVKYLIGCQLSKGIGLRRSIERAPSKTWAVVALPCAIIFRLARFR